MKKKLFIALNSVFLNFPNNNFFKFTVKLIELLIKFDKKNNYYIFFPQNTNLKKILSVEIPPNFNVIKTIISNKFLCF